MRDEDLPSRTVELAVEAWPPGRPVRGDGRARGSDPVDRSQPVTLDNDPTAHAAAVAIRAACRIVGSFSLDGCELFTSCEPCPLCLASALWARVDRVVYAADRDDAARAGFDDREFYALLGKPRTEWPTPVDELRLRSSTAPFEAWLRNPERTPY